MKKSLIALAVAGTLVAPVAMADTSNVEVYGQMNMSLDMVKSGETAANGGSVSANQVVSNESRIGFKGSEDLSGGMSAIFEVEGDVWADSGIGLLATRTAFAGLKSDMAGSVTLGTQYSPYRQSTRKLDLFADGIADNRSLMGGGDNTALPLSNLDATYTNSINYMSPSWAGVSVAAAYRMGAEQAAATTDTKGKTISLAVMYDMAPFYATIAQQKTTYGSASGDDQGTDGDSDKGFKVGGSFKMDMFAVNAVIEKLTNDQTGSLNGVNKSTNIYVAGQFNITSNDAVKLAITKAGDWKTDGVTNVDSGARQMSLGYDHNLSKRTTVYALYTKLDNKATIDNCLRGKSYDGPNNCSNDANPSAFSFGMKHSF